MESTANPLPDRPGGRITWRRLLRGALAAVGVLVAGCLWARWRPAARFRMGSPGEDELRVVTWNVGYFAPVKVKSARAVDIGTIAEVLRSTGAHVAVLQELGSTEQAAEIAEALGPEWRARCVHTGHHGQFLAALTSLPAGRARIREAGGRRMLGLRVMGPKGEDTFVLALHAPHPARGREDTIEYIRAGVAWGRERSEQIRVLAGDLNYHIPTDPPEPGAEDLRGEIDDFLADSTLGLGKTYYARTRIDHVFHFPKELEVVPEGSGLVDLPPRFARVPGWRDHRPIVVTIRTRQGAGSSAGRA